MSEEVHETPSTTPNFQTELAAQLAELMPEVIADGKVDVEKLKELLDGDAADTSERFGLFWPGKKRALRAAQEPTTATLRPDFENSKDWDTTENVFIEGDNLEVLKILQKHYHAKIKMIYIDPPYNTGKDFVYPDNYKEGLDTYLEWTRQVNEEGKKLSTNADTEGRYHSNWLNMMYPRMKLARNLLTEDGVVFISIDDNEQDNLRKLCNEVFGESNFLATLPTVMNLKGNNDQFAFAGTHEYTLVYARNAKQFEPGQFPLEDEALKGWEEDERGPFKRGANLKATGVNAPRSKRPNLYYPIYVGPGNALSIQAQAGWQEVLPMTGGEQMSWRWSKQKFASELDDVVVIPSGKSFSFYKKQRPTLGELPTSKPKSIFYRPEYSSGNGTAVVKNLFEGKKVFENPKPVTLLEDLMLIGLHGGGIMLDLFSGSASAPDALMRLNARDDGGRKFIAIQLPEPTLEESEAAKLGYATLADIARARLDRAGKACMSKVLQANQELRLDVGYRSYKLADTNFSKWKVSSDIDRTDLEQRLFDLRASSSADGASADDLLTEILLKQGYSLSEQIASVSLAGLELRSVGDGLVLAYLDEQVKPTLEQLRTVVGEDPARLVILEDAFHGDDQLKTNLAQLCRSKGIELWTA